MSSSKRSECIYCGSHSYGKPCIYSPHKTHVHMGERDHCIYCGSKYKGAGCIYNPYGKVHVMGPDYSGQIKEQLNKSVVCSYLLQKMTDEPVLTEASSSPLDRFYGRVAMLLGNTGQPFLDALSLDERNIKAELTKEQVVAAFELKTILEQKLSEIAATLYKANQSLPVEIIEESIIEAILS